MKERRILKLHETANGLRLTAYGPDENEIRAVEDAADGRQPTAYSLRLTARRRLFDTMAS
ncbi:MAG: hypothetical protein NTX53_01695 [candidate division WOR-3 bacterium]|nr:hypothetical protein [candidate division WOR-3 bacterium]